MTIHEATFFLLKKLRSICSEDEASQVTDWVMESLTGSKKAERMIYKNSSITDAEEEKLKEWATRLLAHEPVQYVLNEAWFAGMRFYVDKNVLIPRPETEELVDWITRDLNVQLQNSSATTSNGRLSIIDIGTGSGCIPVSIKKKNPDVSVTAVDVCSEAIYVAANNAVNLQAEVNFVLLDFLDRSKWEELGKYNMIVSNPPYVKKEEAKMMHQRVLEHEPHKALFVPDADALIFYEAIAEFGKTHLKAGGSIYVEVNETLGNETAELFRKNEYLSVELRRDMQGKDRMLKVNK